jgi:hypothetical protein
MRTIVAERRHRILPSGEKTITFVISKAGLTIVQRAETFSIASSIKRWAPESACLLWTSACTQKAVAFARNPIGIGGGASTAGGCETQKETFSELIEVSHVLPNAVAPLEIREEQLAVSKDTNSFLLKKSRGEYN